MNSTTTRVLALAMLVGLGSASAQVFSAGTSANVKRAYEHIWAVLP